MPDTENFYNDLININLYINIFFYLYCTMHLQPTGAVLSFNSEGLKILLSPPKIVSFSQLLAVKKSTIFGAARIFFGPS